MKRFTIFAGLLCWHNCTNISHFTFLVLFNWFELPDRRRILISANIFSKAKILYSTNSHILMYSTEEKKTMPIFQSAWYICVFPRIHNKINVISKYSSKNRDRSKQILSRNNKKEWIISIPTRELYLPLFSNIKIFEVQEIGIV